MKTVFYALLTILALTLPAGAAERRIALVVGNANYQTGSLPTPANDAGLVAQTLQAAGFDVTGARDLDQESLRRAFRDFLDKSSLSGPDTVAYIYLSGYGVQLEGENYFVPIDAQIKSAANVPSEALRLSDFTRPLAALGLVDRQGLHDRQRQLREERRVGAPRHAALQGHLAVGEDVQRLSGRRGHCSAGRCARRDPSAGCTTGRSDGYPSSGRPPA